MSESKLGANIRALRKAYGETQEELGFALNIEKNTVSSYENGKREPNKEMLSSIAKHFMVSVEELTNCDLTEIGKITIDNTTFFKNIEMILPIISTKKSLSNNSFKKAYEQHKEFYSGLYNMSLDNIDKIDVCIEGYIDAFEHDEIKAEAAANFLSIWMLMFMMMKTVPQIMKNRPAALMQIVSRDPKVRDIIDNTDPDFEKDASEAINELRDPEIDDSLEEMIVTLKRSSKWSDLADYYIALKYVWNLVDNDLGADFNRRVGAEMMGAFVYLENVYAARFLKYNMESIGQSSQSVDDK